MFVPGIVSATFKTESIDYVLDAALDASLSAVEWSENHHIKKGDLALAEETGRKTRDRGLEIAGYGSYYRLGEGMEIRESLDTASALGASEMRIWAGGKSSSSLSAAERDALLEELEGSVSVAESYGIVLNLEWHKNTLTDTNESGLDTLESLSSPWLRTLWQPTQALTFQERLKGLGMIKPYLSYFHVYYWDETGRRPLEEGISHWREYFSIPDKEKKYYALLEFVKGDSREQFLEDALVLRKLIKGEN